MLSRLISIILLLSLSPVFLLILIIIFIDDGRPCIFSQKRIGKENSIFTMYKFRSMKKNTPELASHLLSMDNNPYIRCGKLLRKLSLDELPQLLNIIKGDMVFIGPRPALYNQTDLIELRTKKNIHKLQPGVTGWAQINGRDNLSISKKVDFDSYYLQNKSIAFDLKILFYTFFKVLKGDSIKL